MNQELFILQGKAEKEKNIRYEVDLNKELGVGGMGRVYFGYQVNEKNGSRKDVAVKFLYEDLDKSVIDRAYREASIQLRNDNLIEMYGLVEIEDTDDDGNTVKHLHVISEYLQGVTLADMLETEMVTDTYGNNIPYAQELLALQKENREDFAVTVLKKVLSGVQALHDDGYIHRDIDPSNIMITEDNRIKLIDFGVARKIKNIRKEEKSKEHTIHGTIIGKASYAASEIALGDVQHHDCTTDIYALGILLFQLVTGHLPFEGDIAEVMDMQIHKPMPLEDVKHEGLRKIIEKATQKLRKDRYQSAAAFRVALDDYDKPSSKIPDPTAVTQLINPYKSGDTENAKVTVVVKTPSKEEKKKEKDDLNKTQMLDTLPIDPDLEVTPAPKSGDYNVTRIQNQQLEEHPKDILTNSGTNYEETISWIVWAVAGTVVGILLGLFI